MLTPMQADKNRPSGGTYPSYERENDRYQNNQPQQPYGGQQFNAPPQSNVPAAPPGGEDPYAAYGGYQNYVALWYSHLAQQGGQQPQGQQGPPGS